MKINFTTDQGSSGKPKSWSTDDDKRLMASATEACAQKGARCKSVTVYVHGKRITGIVHADIAGFPVQATVYDYLS